MAFSSLRYLVLAATAAVATYAAHAVQFPKFAALTVTSEVQVEALAGAVSAINNLQASNAFHEFLKGYSADVAAGTLTVAGHNERIDALLLDVDTIVPGFSKTADTAIAAAVVDFFKFQLTAHAASWEVLYYGASKAETQVGNPDIDPSLTTLDAYMKKHIGTASSADLQAQSDKFFDQAEALAPGFKTIAYNAIGAVYTSLWNQESTEEATASSRPLDGSNDGSASHDSSTTRDTQEDVGYDPSSSPSSPSSTKSHGVPAPSPAHHSSAAVPMRSIATAAIAVVATVLLL